MIQRSELKCTLVSLRELQSQRFVEFMDSINKFATQFNLRQFTNWSKVWEYPWLWFNGLSLIELKGKKVCDLGSELSPMPWFLASHGSKVTLIENNDQFIQTWEAIKEATGWTVDWKIVKDERLPFDDRDFDVVTSFSVIEHLPNKQLAINEVIRVLKPGGLFAISFDICEPSMGMTFPQWNGSALTKEEFETIIWENLSFLHADGNPLWNFDDAPEFIRWHLQSAPHHNYTVGAAMLSKRSS